MGKSDNNLSSHCVMFNDDAFDTLIKMQAKYVLRLGKKLPWNDLIIQMSKDALEMLK